MAVQETAQKSDSDQGIELRVGVIDYLSRDPIDEATVRLVGRFSGEQSVSDSGKTGEALFLVLPGVYVVQVEEEGYLTSKTTLEIPDRVPFGCKQVELKPTIIASGRVATHLGSPVDGAQITFIGHQMPDDSNLFRSATRNDGSFELVVVPGVYEVRATRQPNPSVVLESVPIRSQGDTGHPDGYSQNCIINKYDDDVPNELMAVYAIVYKGRDTNEYVCFIRPAGN